MKRLETLTVVIAAMMFTYLLGYHDGARTKHRTANAEVIP